VRNVVGSPLAGIDPLEDFDTRQLWYVCSCPVGGRERGRERGKDEKKEIE
jgi:hypothetical protein